MEIKLKKVDGWRWEKLEGDGSTNAAKQFDPGKSHPFFYCCCHLLAEKLCFMDSCLVLFQFVQFVSSFLSTGFFCIFCTFDFSLACLNHLIC